MRKQERPAGAGRAHGQRAQGRRFCQFRRPGVPALKISVEVTKRYYSSSLLCPNDTMPETVKPCTGPVAPSRDRATTAAQ